MKVILKSGAGFTLVENVMTVALVSLLSLGLLGMIITATHLTKSARESINAAEVAEGKLESLRSCSWTQLQSTNFVPLVFTATNGIVYSGRITFQKPLATEAYKDDVVEATVDVTWTSDSRARSMQVTTFLSRYGISSSQQ